jgi:hypothetical protein
LHKSRISARQLFFRRDEPLSWCRFAAMSRTATAIVCLVVASACGPSDRNRPGDGNGTPDGGGNVGSGSGNQDGCSDAAKIVYVVDQNNTLSSFDPSTKTFHDLGTLNCPAQLLATPFSMAIDRSAAAWVLYSSGELFHVDTSSASLPCTATNWHSANGLMQFGMGFSTDQSGGSTDTLFIAGGDMTTTTSATLAKLDTTAFTASTVGTVTGWPELTGTGSAELWGFFPDATSPRVEKINKTSGAPVTTYPLTSLAGQPMAWAFAFWGGDFWVFLERSTDSATTVYQVDGANGTIKGMTPTNTRQIVGAGVSTCAPVVIQ